MPRLLEDGDDGSLSEVPSIPHDELVPAGRSSSQRPEVSSRLGQHRQPSDDGWVPARRRSRRPEVSSHRRQHPQRSVEKDTDDLVIPGMEPISQLIRRRLLGRVVSRDPAFFETRQERQRARDVENISNTSAQEVDPTEAEVVRTLNSITLDGHGDTEGEWTEGEWTEGEWTEGEGTGGEGTEGEETEGEETEGEETEDPDDDEDEEEFGFLPVVGQALDEPVSNNARYEVEVDEDIVTHTSQTVKEYVSDMKICEPGVAYTMAARLLNTKGSLDWAAENIEFTEEGDMRDNILNIHHLDFLSIDAMPNTNIGGDERGNLSNGKLSFCQWHKPYQSYRASTAEHSFFRRTMRIAEVDNQEIFIVMRPKPDEQALDIDNHTFTASQALRRSAMSRPHAQQLLIYICNIMMTTRRLSRHGVTMTWKLGGLNTADMDRKDWRILYSKMVERWPEFLAACPEHYWIRQEITLHIYEIGQDVCIRSRDCSDGTLAYSLSRMYDAGSVSTFIYALATNVSIESATTDEGDGTTSYEAKSTLFDTKEVTRDYLNVRGAGLRIFPMAFSPSVCSFQALKAPQTYQSAVIDPINRHLREENLMDDNDDDEEPDSAVVKVVLFQGYSMLKQYCRHRPNEFLLGLGTYTCTLCAPEKLGKVHTDKQTKYFHGVSAGAPFTAFDNGIVNAVANGRVGSRFEPVISVDFQALKEENRTWDYICEHIIRPTLLWTGRARALYGTWMRLYEPSVFPAILRDMSYIFRILLDGLIALWVKNKKQSGLIAAEAIATVERLAIFMFTGNRSHIPTRVWQYIGLQQNLDNFAWPFLLPGKIDLRAIPKPESRTANWCRDVHNRTLILSHLASVKFHFGDAAAARREISMSMLSAEEIISTDTATTMLRQAIRKFMVPQLQEVVLKSLREQHSTMCSISAAAAIGSTPEDLALASVEVTNRENLLETFGTSEHPFEKSLMHQVIDRFYQRSHDRPWKDPIVPFPASELDIIQPLDLASMIMSWNPDTSRCIPLAPSTRYIRCGPLSLSKKGMSWVDTMFETMRAGSLLTVNQWLEALRSALRWECIEIIPGPYNGCLSGRRFTRVLEYTGFNTNKKRARRETPAEAMESAVKRLRTVTRLPLSVPLEETPADYASGMRVVLQRYDKSTSDPEGVPGAHISAFLRRAAAALDLDEPSHNLCLLIGYVLSRNTPPPIATCYSRLSPERFVLADGTKLGTPRDQWYFIFMIRCLMWLCPEVNREEPGHCPASIVLKIFEHKKVNNRLLEGLKICVRTNGHRLWPKSSEMKLNTEAYFLQTMTEATAASKIGARRVMQMWLPPAMVDRAVALLESGSSEEGNY